MDQGGLASGNFVTNTLGSMPEATGQMPEALEAVLSHSLPVDARDGDADDADSMPGDAAEAMLGEDEGVQGAEANSMSAEPGAQPGASGGTEAAPAVGHPPQMAVLASLDQVCMLLFTCYHLSPACACA